MRNKSNCKCGGRGALFKDKRWIVCDGCNGMGFKQEKPNSDSSETPAEAAISLAATLALATAISEGSGDTASASSDCQPDNAGPDSSLDPGGGDFGGGGASGDY